MNKRTFFFLLTVAVFTWQCGGSHKAQVGDAGSSVDSTKGLKDYYKDYFRIGAAITPADTRNDNAPFIRQEFNSITAENVMKMGPIHPEEARYYWNDADSIAAFAERNGIGLRGHNLCWHQQTPRWMFRDTLTHATVTKEVLLQRLKDHIYAVAGRYKGKVYAWDVVNEAIADDSATYMRPSPWFQICGEDFIAAAFRYAHEADPKAALFYNDYNTEQPVKREKIYRLLKKLKAEGVPVNGIGLQAHWSVSTPTQAELEKSIEMFSSLGLQVQITELDISVYAGRQGGQIVNGQPGQRPPQQPAVFTPEMEQQQLEKYKMVFDVFRKYKKQITAVTFWNLSDRYSWLDSRGRKNFPLLFDKDLKPKKAFWEVVKF